MARKRKQSSIDTTPQVQEKLPVITPEIEDGYDGVVKRLSCSICQRIFYITDTDYQTLSPCACHDCSTKLLQDYQRKLKELEILRTEMEEVEKWKKIIELRQREMDEELGQTYVRPRVEESIDKKAWNYGCKLLYCVEHPIEKGQWWTGVVYRNNDQKRTSTHICFFLWKFDEHCSMLAPLSETIHPLKDKQEREKDFIEKYPERVELFQDEG
jgi:hypothetical protein